MITELKVNELDMEMLEKATGGAVGPEIEPIESDRPSIPEPPKPLPQEPDLPKSGNICPYCGSGNVIQESLIVQVGMPVLCLCKDCRKSFKV